MRTVLIGLSASASIAALLAVGVVSSAAALPPTYTITISASRVGAGVYVDGSVSDDSVRTAMTPMVKLPGASVFTQGVNIRTVHCSTFTWSRHIRAGRTISVYFTDGVVESNVIQITPTNVGVGTRSASRALRC